MKSNEDWIKESLEETPRLALRALTAYFAEVVQDGFADTNAKDLLGYLLKEGFKIVKDDKERSV